MSTLYACVRAVSGLQPTALCGRDGARAEENAAGGARRQQAKWPGSIVTASGTTFRHVSIAWLQRGAKAQPGGRLARSGGGPGIATSRAPARRRWMISH
jgi:hypothetical protein